MKATRSLPVLFALAAVAAGIVYLATAERDVEQDWEERKLLFQEAALRAETLIRAINSYTSTIGHPPAALADIIPEYLDKLPATGLEQCKRIEYRLLTHKQGSIVWYDLGSRQGQPHFGRHRYSVGDPEHAILVFTLDTDERVTSALIERMPKGREPQDFESEAWKKGVRRIEMALALADTYKLDGMPRDVFEQLLGMPDGSLVVHGTPWELRINCPTGLLNHDCLVYWPTGNYPQHLYGGMTEPVGKWVYVHS